MVVGAHERPLPRVGRHPRHAGHEVRPELGAGDRRAMGVPAAREPALRLAGAGEAPGPARELPRSLDQETQRRVAARLDVEVEGAAGAPRRVRLADLLPGPGAPAVRAVGQAVLLAAARGEAERVARTVTRARGRAREGQRGGHAGRVVERRAEPAVVVRADHDGRAALAPRQVANHVAAGQPRVRSATSVSRTSSGRALWDSRSPAASSLLIVTNGGAPLCQCDANEPSARGDW